MLLLLRKYFSLPVSGINEVSKRFTDKKYSQNIRGQKIERSILMESSTVSLFLEPSRLQFCNYSDFTVMLATGLMPTKAK